ncbi:MAG: transcriptional repressor [Dysgonamonadaceae bacterium]|jgi:Fur family ferric uptake transcriptional regulator|nr:transcriptional repressor [Dysgonamonadaceae bacterium]
MCSKKDDNIQEIVKQKFTEYLTAMRYRKTPERYAILNLIYTDPRHFDMETLYEAMTKSNFRVSRATLYNTMQLLVDCNLVIKHQFGKNLSVYERAYNNDLHHHLICTNCHKIQEYKGYFLTGAIQRERMKRFKPTHYNLYIYGLCNICARELKKQQNLNKK